MESSRKAPRLRELSVVAEIGARRVLPLQRTTSCTFFSTNEQRHTRHNITCSSSNLVYMIQCNKCNVQYIGETKRHLSDRFGERRRAIEKAIAKQHINQPTAVSDHFTLPAHSMDNIELVPLELITSNRDGIRKAREDISNLQGQDHRTLRIKHLFFIFLHICVFVNQSCHIYFL